MGLAKLGGCVVAAAVLLSGCWGQPGFGPANRRYNDLEKTLTAANVAGLTQDWTVGVGASLGEPIVSRGRVYVTGRNPDDFLRVRALAINNGAQLWDRQVADVIGSGGQVTLSRNELSVSHSLGFCPGGGITRLDPADGHELIFMETQPWGHVVTGSDIVADVRDDLCEPSGPATLVVRDADTLATLWTAVLPEANQPVSSDMTPTIAHGHIYVAVTPSHVYVIADGAFGYGVMFAFSTTCASENGCVDWFTAWENRKPTNIAVAGDVVYMTLADPFPNQQPPHAPFGFLEAWPAAGCGGPICPDPLVRLSTEGRQPSELSVSGGRVFLVSSNGGTITTLTAYGLA